ncbi:TPA: hypothetical protein DD449_05065 [Candidatus Berkelbacteria bacterium]|uniref:Lipoprotein n=1 Tax=Berkelbacteria bacterium GW2011_GWE1_39_12 TaxID=1618337 RepID=A0A0G4B5Y7_9BACT|nr:MAG: hypothetical protein UT28_C0001G0632 [Berkelbacteria bacterium GW2011_GWE1_39_12]HBO61023.1 hypothetical protein [Candidatus Berkelbacteria bacterium]
MTKITKIAIISSILFFTAGCGTAKDNTVSTTTSGNDFTNQDTKTVTTNTQTNLAKAKVAANAWKSDAYFAGLNFRVPGDLNPLSLSMTYIFGSNEDKDNWFTYSIDAQNKFVRAAIPKADFLGTDLQPIQEQYWKKSYVDILRTADDNGGTAYKAQHPEAQTTVTLSQSAPKNWTWYVVEYRGATDAQKIRISANDGLIYNDSGILVSK